MPSDAYFHLQTPAEVDRLFLPYETAPQRHARYGEKCITCHAPASHAVGLASPDDRYPTDPWRACDQHVGRFAAQPRNYIVKRLENR